ncbi:hypothetical protein GFB49_09970 [Epibacterium sp. SM1979]|uniref:Uncharacterized protein n=1 Tax=Tritonibacter litoralis TaxID=2662264 RepID=A0A843YBV3_9RHOB|nr:hypothetical protein [Tritonibacter litoralis]MQQ08780.1 hypothetical protein [Tritonibacter litoralis]
MSKITFTLFILTSFGIGLFGASRLWPRDSRAERIMWLFSHYCLPPYSEDLAEELRQNLDEWHPFGESQGWLDDVSGSILSVDATRCTISTFAPFALDHDEAAELRDLVNAFAPQRFPELQFDSKSQLGRAELATAWMTGAVQSAERWGIYSFAYPDLGERAGSSLSYARAPLPR